MQDVLTGGKILARTKLHCQPGTPDSRQQARGRSFQLCSRVDECNRSHASQVWRAFRMSFSTLVNAYERCCCPSGVDVPTPG
jgi:hypothetical protein